MSNRVKAVRISGVLWQEVFTTGYESGGREYITRCVKGLPEGAAFRNAFYKEWQGYESTPELIFIFEHPDFEKVLDGQPIPELVVEFEQFRIENIFNG